MELTEFSGSHWLISVFRITALFSCVLLKDLTTLGFCIYCTILLSSSFIDIATCSHCAFVSVLTDFWISSHDKRMDCSSYFLCLGDLYP